MHGLIIVDKPAGPTSAQVVRLIKSRLGRGARVGHLGTLDPFATGVLPIMIGEGTKIAPFLQEGDKEYTGLIRLGVETDTLDCTGAVARTASIPPLERERLDGIARRFTGTILQTPPIFSAIKRAGVPLYKMARRGDQVEAPVPRQVEIKRLELAPGSPDTIRLIVVCSTGMYVRALARDIGIALDSAAHLLELRRTRNGGFAIAQASPLDTVIDELEGHDCRALIGLRDSLAEMPEVEVDARLARRLRDGDSRALDGLAPRAARFKVISAGRLIAIAEPVSRLTSTLLRGFNPD